MSVIFNRCKETLTEDANEEGHQKCAKFKSSLKTVMAEINSFLQTDATDITGCDVSGCNITDHEKQLIKSVSDDVYVDSSVQDCDLPKQNIDGIQVKSSRGSLELAQTATDQARSFKENTRNGPQNTDFSDDDDQLGRPKMCFNSCKDCKLLEGSVRYGRKLDSQMDMFQQDPAILDLHMSPLTLSPREEKQGQIGYNSALATNQPEQTQGTTQSAAMSNYASNVAHCNVDSDFILLGGSVSRKQVG